MEDQIEQLIHHIQERFGLTNYYLGRHHYFYKVDNGKTTYLLSTEWFPNEHEETDEDLNPTGTAVISVDIHKKAIKGIVFVNETSYEVDGDFPTPTTESVMEWVEALTDLTFGRQFQLLSEKDGAFTFQAVVDNIPVYPPGTISVEFNKEKKLCSFYIDGMFPQEEEVEWEPFALTPEKTDRVAKNQCVLAEIPYDQKEKWMPIYAIEEVFLTNDGVKTIPFEVSTVDRSMIQIDEVVEWDRPLDKPFMPEEIDFSREITEKTALLNKAHPDSFPLTQSDQKTCAEAVRNFLRQVYPDASGEWILKGLYRDNGHIHATLRPVKQGTVIFKRKLTLILDSEQCRVVNYVDNGDLLDMFGDFEKAESAVLTQEEAYQKLHEYVTVTPRYVYSSLQKGYILCGKIDCDYGVHAVTGEIMRLEDF